MLHITIFNRSAAFRASFCSMDALIHLKESRDMVKKRFPPSEYGASHPDLGIASELRPFSLTSGHVFTTNALGTNRPSRKAWPDEAGREGGEREVVRGVAVAGPGHSDRSCPRADLQRWGRREMGLQ